MSQTFHRNVWLYFYIGSKFVRERKGGSSTILNFVSRLCRDFNSMYFSFFMPAPPKSHQKIRKYAKRILRNTFPHTPSISQNFARVPHLHFRTPPRLKNIVAEYGAFPRTSASAEALCFAQRRVARGERLWILSAVFDKIGSSGIV